MYGCSLKGHGGQCVMVVGVQLLGAWWPVCDGCRDAAYRSMVANV